MLQRSVQEGSGDGRPGDDLQIGNKLRKARHQRGLTLDQLALSTGLTKSFLSQLERDHTSASVASLLRVCRALAISPGSLFATPATSLVRADHAPRINFGGTGVVEVLLTPRDASCVQVIRSEIEAGGGSGDEAYRLDTDAEVVHVLHGALTVAVEGKHVRLEAGDTLSFYPRDLHSWQNPLDTTSIVLWILAPSPW